MQRSSDQFDSGRRDREALTAVRHRIEHSRHKGLRRVKVKINDGTIIVTGTVPTEEDRELALQLVGDVKYVEGVIDELRIASSEDT